MNEGKALVVLKNWSHRVDKETNKIVDYKAVYGEITAQHEKTTLIADKLVILIDSILTMEFGVEEIPKEWIIGNWDVEKYNELTGASPVYIIE